MEHNLRNRQRGAALIMALVVLTILTLLAVSSLGTTNLEEKMAANVKNKSLAFQAAESALRVAENWLSITTTQPTFPDTPKALYLPSTTVPLWEDASIWTGNKSVVYPNIPGTSGAKSDLAQVANPPRYIIEQMQEVPDPALTSTTVYYRITARGEGGTSNAIAMVQSVVSRTWPRP